MTEKQGDNEYADRSFISGKALERHFELQRALFEFSKLFDEKEENAKTASA